MFHNQTSFEERMGREARSILRTQTGIEDPAEIKRRLDKLNELETADETRRREAMSAQERLQADLNAEKEARAAAERQAAAERDRATVTGLCASKGIRNVNYALFEVTQARGTNAAFDVGKHLDALLEKPDMRAALGIPSDPVVPAPVTTSPSPGNPSPDPPRVTPPAMVDAMAMSPEAFSAHLASLGAG